MAKLTRYQVQVRWERRNPLLMVSLAVEAEVYAETHEDARADVLAICQQFTNREPESVTVTPVIRETVKLSAHRAGVRP